MSTIHRRLRVLMLSIVLIQLHAQAQFVITDARFLNAVQNAIPNALTGNVLDTLSNDVLTCTSLHVTSPVGIESQNLDGIEYFVNLESLDITYAHITDIHGLPNSIRYLVLNFLYPGLHSIDRWPDSLRILTAKHDWYWNQQNSGLQPLPPFPDHLESLELNGQSFVELPPMPASLRYLDMERNRDLATIYPLPNGLRHLNVQFTALTSLPVLPDSLENLIFGNSPQFDHLGPLPSNLRELHAGYASLLSEIPPLPSTLEILEFQGPFPIAIIPELPDGLQELLLAHFSAVDALPTLPADLQVLKATSMTNLHVLPPLPPGLTNLNTAFTPITCYPYVPATVTEWTLAGSCVPNLPPNLAAGSNAWNLPICNVVNAGNCPTVEMAVGHVFRDDNGNGTLDPGETPFSQAQITGTPGTHLAGIGQDGTYALALDTGTFTVDGTDIPWYVRTTPAHTVTITYPFGVDSLNDIGYQPIPGIVDVAVSLSSNIARPGFVHKVWSTFTNVGTSVADVTCTVIFDPYLPSPTVTPPADQVVGNQYTWLLIGMVPGFSFTPEFSTTLLASVPIGYTFNYSANVVTSPTDVAPQNNTDELICTTVGSFDPNDKTVDPPFMDPATLLSGQTMDYTIRFQNTGTYQADRVVITDTLPTGLMQDSLKFLNSSHLCTWYMNEGVLVIIFNNIFLADSTSNEPESHGFARFRISPDQGMSVGTTVTNLANIYFDFNEPVITPPCDFETTMTTEITASAVPELSAGPNPTRDRLFVQLPHSSSLATVRIYDATGRTMVQLTKEHGTVMIDLSKWPASVYILHVEQDGAHFEQRVVKVN